MSKPTEHKTVQARILAYAEAISWTVVSREVAEERRGGIPAHLRRKDGDRNVPAPVRTFNPRHAEAEGALLGQWWRLPSSLAGNRGFPFISNMLN
jgi:type I restriction enzyme R subunit